MPYVKARKTIRKRKSVKRMRTKSRMPKVVSTVLKRYVKSAIKRNSETKFPLPLSANNVGIGPYNATSALLTTIDLTNVFDIAQGTGQGGRIGDEITPTKLSFKGYINLQYQTVVADTTTLVQKPMYVKMVIGRQKNTMAQPANYSNLFQAGSTVAAPSNMPTDMLLNFNKDSYVIYATRVFKIGNSKPDVIANTDNSSNNDFSLARMFNINLIKHVPRLKYSDANDYPTNFGIYAWFLICAADGSIFGATNYPAPEIHYTVEAAFKDS